MKKFTHNHKRFRRFQIDCHIKSLFRKKKINCPLVFVTFYPLVFPKSYLANVLHLPENWQLDLRRPKLSTVAPFYPKNKKMHPQFKSLAVITFPLHIVSSLEFPMKTEVTQ